MPQPDPHARPDQPPAAGSPQPGFGVPWDQPAPDDGNTVLQPPAHHAPQPDHSDTVLIPRPQPAAPAPDDGQTVLTPRHAASGPAPDTGATVLAPRPQPQSSAPQPPAPDGPDDTVLIPRDDRWRPVEPAPPQTGDTVLAPGPGQQGPGQPGPAPDSGHTVLAPRPGQQGPAPDSGHTVLGAPAGRPSGTAPAQVEDTISAPLYPAARANGAADSEVAYTPPPAGDWAPQSTPGATATNDPADRFAPPPAQRRGRRGRPQPIGMPAALEGRPVWMYLLLGFLVGLLVGGGVMFLVAFAIG